MRRGRTRPVFFRLSVFAAAILLLSINGAAAEQLPINGDVSWEGFGYPNPQTNGQFWEDFFAATLKSHGGVPHVADLSYEMDLRAVADDAHFTAGLFDPRNSHARRPYLAFQELYLSYRLLPELRIVAGKQLVEWSIMEGLQPANLMNPHDESDPFRQWEEGVYSVALHYDKGNFGGDLIAVPISFVPSRVPQGRWEIIPGDVSQIQDLPPVRLSETQIGARLRAQLGDWDVAGIAYNGRNTEAIFVPQLIFVGGDQLFQLNIHEQYSNLFAGGVQVSRPIGESLIARFESIYFHSQNQIQDDLLHSDVGLEYVLENWRVFLNYFRQDITGYAPLEVTDKGALQFFRSFFGGELRYEPPQGLRVEIRGGHDFTQDFSLVQPEVSSELVHNLRLAISANIITATRFSYFFQIRNDDRFGLRLQYFF